MNQSMYSRIILLSVSIAAAAATPEFELRCFVTHLRNDGVNEELLSSVESVSDFKECSAVITSFLQEFYDMFVPKEARFQDCVKMSVSNSGLKNAFLLAEAVKRFDVGWKLWKTSGKNERYQKLIDVLQVGLRVVQDNCNEVLVKESLAADFDKHIDVRKFFQGDQEFCIRKHLVNIELMDYYTYNLNLNPKSINPEAADCDQIISTLQENTYVEMKKHTADCKIAVYRKNDYMEYYMKIEFVLPQLSLSQNQVAVERERFVAGVLAIRKKAAEACDA